MTIAVIVVAIAGRGIMEQMHLLQMEQIGQACNLNYVFGEELLFLK